MAQRKSTGLVNFMADSGSTRAALANSRIFIYSGSQPASADNSVSGTLLVTLTKSGGAFVQETLPQWSFSLSGASGLVSTVTIGGITCIDSTVAYVNSATDTATLLAAAITNYFGTPDFKATSVGTTVTITGPKGCGATLNNLDLDVTVSGGDAAVNINNSGNPTVLGVTCVNGCNFKYPASGGILSKEDDVWSGTIVTSGTAGWFRIEADADDSKALSTVYKRLDGSIGTANSDMVVSSTNLLSGGVYTISSGSITINK